MDRGRPPQSTTAGCRVPVAGWQVSGAGTVLGKRRRGVHGGASVKMAARRASNGPRMGPDAPETAPRWPKTGPRRPQDGARRLEEGAASRGAATWQREGANAWEVRQKAAGWAAEAAEGEGENSDIAWEGFQKVENEGFQARGLLRQNGRFVWEGWLKTGTTTKVPFWVVVVLSRRNACRGHSVEAKWPERGRGGTTIIFIKN